MFERVRTVSVTLLGITLCLFTLAEVNFPRVQPQSALAIFVMLGIVLCFLVHPLHRRLKDNQLLRCLDVILALATVICCGYIVIQTEATFKNFWAQGISLGNRAGLETTTDFVIGLVGVMLVLEATRRSIGWIVPLLALAFVAHSFYCHLSNRYGLPPMPLALLPHSGQSLKDISSTTFLQTLGVFGPAAGVMFKYVFLFVVFGAFLEMSGATQFIIDFAQRVFGGSPGGPAKVSVLGSGLMGSLSGSAVANAVTTGTFTIPMMRNTGFEPHIAGGITAAAASGGALVPPVMGAGAYMMLELVQPQVTFLEIAKAALIPAFLYYLSIFMIVHFYSRRVGAKGIDTAEREQPPLWQFEMLVFFGALAGLVGLLLLKFSPFRAVTGSLIVILVLATLRRKLRLGFYPRVLAISSFVLVMVLHHLLIAEGVARPTARQIFDSWLGSAIWGMFGLLVFGLVHPIWRPAMVEAFTKSAKNGISLVAASACVGIIIGIVQQTGIASDFSSVIKGVVESNLFLALVGIMVCSIVLGMGVPSVVCYLLMATLMGSMLGELGVIPLAAHLFIFYFGMMSMVTPPVALAAYASASIAQAKIMPTALAAFRFSLVGFTLPFMFVYRPELLLLSDKPEFKLAAVKIAEETATQRATISGSLLRIDTGLGDTKIEFSQVGRTDTVRTVRTNSDGTFQLEIEAGSWRVVSITSDGQRLHLGTLSFDPSPSRQTTVSDGPGTNEQRVQFQQRGLSILQVLAGTGVAALGIIALAAGIAGYMLAPLGALMRVCALGSAALLLFPDRGFAIGDFSIAVSDVAGIVVFAVITRLNGRGKPNALPQPTTEAAS